MFEQICDANSGYYVHIPANQHEIVKSYNIFDETTHCLANDCIWT